VGQLQERRATPSEDFERSLHNLLLSANPPGALRLFTCLKLGPKLLRSGIGLSGRPHPGLNLARSTWVADWSLRFKNILLVVRACPKCMSAL
jgi:hypothetical protein